MASSSTFSTSGCGRQWRTSHRTWSSSTRSPPAPRWRQSGRWCREASESSRLSTADPSPCSFTTLNGQRSREGATRFCFLGRRRTAGRTSRRVFSCACMSLCLEWRWRCKSATNGFFTATSARRWTATSGDSTSGPRSFRPASPARWWRGASSERASNTLTAPTRSPTDQRGAQQMTRPTLPDLGLKLYGSGALRKTTKSTTRDSDRWKIPCVAWRRLMGLAKRRTLLINQNAQSARNSEGVRRSLGRARLGW
mmetsp:Transcript_36517/g.82984  ORF Transcript_36517/g.82984 Transcript_36517/m.82984 type:complete len:253 (+) Transcript_36517:737-1495(+)